MIFNNGYSFSLSGERSSSSSKRSTNGVFAWNWKHDSYTEIERNFDSTLKNCVNT